MFASSSSMKEETGRLVVYSGRSESLVAPIIEQFSEAAGIDVQVKYGSTFAMAATLLEEGSNSPADVFFAQDPGGLGAVSAMLSPLPADVVLKVPAWARSPDGSWVGISGRARVIVYSTELVSEEELPTSVKDLTDPKWKGRIGWPPGNASFRTMVTAMRFMLSKVAQQYFAGQTFEYPLVEGVKTHRLLPPIDTLNGPDIDLSSLSDLQGTDALLRETGVIP